MRKSTAKQIALHGITWGDIREMMLRAFDAGAADERRSIVNKSFTKATCFNILYECIETYDTNSIVVKGNLALGAIHCLREFGDYWDGWRPDAKKQDLPPPVHREAIDPRLVGW